MKHIVWSNKSLGLWAKSAMSSKSSSWKLFALSTLNSHQTCLNAYVPLWRVETRRWRWLWLQLEARCRWGHVWYGQIYPWIEGASPLSSLRIYWRLRIHKIVRPHTPFIGSWRSKISAASISASSTIVLCWKVRLLELQRWSVWPNLVSTWQNLRSRRASQCFLIGSSWNLAFWTFTWVPAW